MTSFPSTSRSEWARCSRTPDARGPDAETRPGCCRDRAPGHRTECPPRCSSLPWQRQLDNSSRGESVLLVSRGVMTVDRRIQLWSALVERAADAEVGLEHVGATMVTVAGVTGVAITVRLAATPREAFYASDRVATELEELILTLGEGPSVDALVDGPVLVSDLSDAECAARWPAFTDAAMSAGVRALFSLPLRVGAVRLGVMDLYRDKPGPLERSQLADALVLADTACALLLDGQGRQRAAWSARARPGPPTPSRGTSGDRNDQRSARRIHCGGADAVACLRLCA